MFSEILSVFWNFECFKRLREKEAKFFRLSEINQLHCFDFQFLLIESARNKTKKWSQLKQNYFVSFDWKNEEVVIFLVILHASNCNCSMMTEWFLDCVQLWLREDERRSSSRSKTFLLFLRFDFKLWISSEVCCQAVVQCMY